MRAQAIGPRPAPKPRLAKNYALREVNQRVARRLKTLRVIRRLTQDETGNAVGLTHQQIAKYERGHSKIAPDMLWKLAEYFEVDIAYFFDGLDQDLPAIDPQTATRQTVRKHLRRDLIGALDAVADREMLRGLLGFLRAAHSRDRDE